ncbi:hypothetical protein FHS29_002534 [Saccharothrix tamanrassetensis]|uniref:Short-chain dehydrogenase n=1 Tax=Saccharothrix tamanrassetensis TaxID=1051531 RepID=A0A841CG37_9PSEU|nr:hypothetical protein [Saccharothrix tamanrassetensis]MBB5955953.1 hypothetical protein [Saccharothrix tamanrassetensis]
MNGRTALVLGGTGMLKGCADDLLAQGWQVVLPSRRPPRAGMAARAALGGRGHVPQQNVSRDESRNVSRDGAQSRSRDGARDDSSDASRNVSPTGAKWVRADWARPEELAESVRDALAAPADLLVAWVHLSYRVPVLRAVAPLLAPHAPVVEVHDSGGISSRHGVPDPILPGHPTQQVVLGFVRHGGAMRWLSHEETSVGVLDAVHRALEGKPPSVLQVGEVDTWAVRS